MARSFYDEPRTFPALCKLEQLEMVISADCSWCLLWTCAMIKAAPFLRRFAIEISCARVCLLVSLN